MPSPAVSGGSSPIRPGALGLHYALTDRDGKPIAWKWGQEARQCIGCRCYTDRQSAMMKRLSPALRPFRGPSPCPPSVTFKPHRTQPHAGPVSCDQTEQMPAARVILIFFHSRLWVSSTPLSLSLSLSLSASICSDVPPLPHLHTYDCLSHTTPTRGDEGMETGVLGCHLRCSLGPAGFCRFNVVCFLLQNQWLSEVEGREARCVEPLPHGQT